MKFTSSITLALSCFALSITSVADEPVDFARDIQPILSENCYFCHGPDAKQRVSDLRLDIEEEAKQSIVAFDADASELFSRIKSDDPDERMPPPDSHRSLTPDQVSLIKQWISEGGKWGQHWAYKPIVKPEMGKIIVQAPVFGSSGTPNSETCACNKPRDDGLPRP